jgi:hypothetical protein
MMTKAILVQTKSREKGYVYYNENEDLNAEKLEVKLLNEKMIETGDVLFCSPSSLTAIGRKTLK